MSVLERLGELWAAWLDIGLPTGLLIALLAIAALTWLGLIGLTARIAAKAHRGAFSRAVLIAILPVLVLALAIAWPAMTPWIALGAAGFAALLALLSGALIRHAEATCSNGHRLAPDWVYCPYCPPPPPPAPAANLAPPAGVAASPGVPFDMTHRAPVVVAVAPPGPAYAPAAPPYQRPAEPSGPTLIRLIAEAGDGAHTVSTNGAVIGRNPAAEISIDDQSASWDHARVVARDGSPSVVDLGSSNGTYVNEERVETSLLIPGDRLRIGETVFKVVS